MAWIWIAARSRGCGASRLLPLSQDGLSPGGWRDVKTSFIIAIVALVLFFVVRLAENADLQTMKDAVNRMTR